MHLIKWTCCDACNIAQSAARVYNVWAATVPHYGVSTQHITRAYIYYLIIHNKNLPSLVTIWL